MKIQLTLFLVFVQFNLMAQLNIEIPFYSLTNKYSYEDVVYCEKSDSFLFNSVKKWSNDQGFDYEIIEGDNLEIKIKAHNDITFINRVGLIKVPMTGVVTSTISIKFKNGRYKYVISNFRITESASGSTESLSLEQAIENYDLSPVKKSYGRFLESLCEGIHSKIKSLIANLTISVCRDEDDNDW